MYDEKVLKANICGVNRKIGEWNIEYKKTVDLRKRMQIEKVIEEYKQIKKELIEELELYNQQVL